MTDVLGGGQDVGGSVGDTWGHRDHPRQLDVRRRDQLGRNVSDGRSDGRGGAPESCTSRTRWRSRKWSCQTGGMDAETGFGAVAMNYIPKDGGNTLTYYGSVNGTNENLQWSNFGSELSRARAQREAGSGTEEDMGPRRRRRRSGRARQAVVLHRAPLVGHAALHEPELPESGAAAVVRRPRTTSPISTTRPCRTTTRDRTACV